MEVNEANWKKLIYLREQCSATTFLTVIQMKLIKERAIESNWDSTIMGLIDTIVDNNRSVFNYAKEIK
jgi:hypothetical protein